MTREEKVNQICVEAQNQNIVRFIVKQMFPNVANQLTEEMLDWYLQEIAAYKLTPGFRAEDAVNFAQKLMIEFTTENIYMGITQDGMISAVRKSLSEVILCMITGSLYDAIAEVKAIPVEKKDPKYITNARLTAFVNKIEDYLLVPRTTVT